ncbi:hypothetical protein [Defluviimonas salinarum]|uniref:DUF3375 domain-containing protein n=1 Tax=Defluviimonas salinarum TaxID=2992147 RepID=A0ABT3J9L5_9RHOB|nr:hypothetical protein [Defluviimonas salinarum]MCW3784388.1 hypothetical protein [Defluviimonas salinarum]
MDPLKEHFALLARHSDLIGRIYRERSVEAGQDSQKALAALHAARIVIGGEDDSYRLSPRDRAYLDSVFDRHRAFAAGSPIAPEIERLTKLVEEMRHSFRQGDDAAHHDQEQEAIDTIWLIREEVEGQLRLFDMMTRNGYHDARSLEERIRRNEFYHGRAGILAGAIADLNGALIRDHLAASHAGEVRAVFRRQVLDRIEGWSTRLAGLIREMLEFMYRSKEVAARTKRLRSIFHALRTIPASEQIDALLLADNQMLPEGLPARIRPDLRDAGLEAAAIAAARKLDPDATRSARRSRHASGAVVLDREIPAAEVFSGADPVEMLLAEVRASDVPVSVRDWAAWTGSDGGSMVIDVFDYLLEGSEGIAMETVPPGSPVFTSGVRDLILSRAA